ncbi:hypothetical protein [Mucilaginibacter flavus]|uniref:hypothetical protein n=1 Tax=Mucilaginibacter flavus TaxID=931504 RepID=UPI0025B2892C|nr:hypothetical protein [Mucilaginibacter flavus]MDN3580361.1 hypothetical protein [Mucilaginibacter flavus]
MTTNLRNALTLICTELTNSIELKFQRQPLGCCYLIGHCLAEGLTNAGFFAEEITGHLILKDKFNKSLVYGNAKFKGKLVGYYHTWCTLKYGEETIVIDPSLRYSKIALKTLFGIKLDVNLPDILISNDLQGNSYRYIQDEKLTIKSKEFLRTVNMEAIKQLTGCVTNSTVKLLRN